MDGVEALGGLNRRMRVVSDYKASALQVAKDLRMYLVIWVTRVPAHTHAHTRTERGTPPFLWAELICLFEKNAFVNESCKQRFQQISEIYCLYFNIILDNFLQYCVACTVSRINKNGK